MNGSLAAVQSRIAEIQSRFAPPASHTTQSAAFDLALQKATRTMQSRPAGGGHAMPASGVAGAASGEAVVAGAERYLGVPYKWGGTDPAVGLDCSGLIQLVYKELGVDLPRVSRDQAKVGTPVASLADARPGDLVAFGSPVDHIGIYAGDGEMIVAPHTGAVVRRQRITADPVAIRRVLPEAAPASAPVSGAVPGPAAAAAVSRGSAPYETLFAGAESRHSLPAGLLRAVAAVESAFNPRAVSHAGAQGLMQLMPSTAAGLGVDAFDPAQAVDGAGRLLRSHLDRFGSMELALAAYNAGPGAVSRHGGIPPYAETQAYVRKVMDRLRGAAA